ncbi:amino acid adenylation domain-containing protein [Photobacterium sanguinicancri]
MSYMTMNVSTMITDLQAKGIYLWVDAQQLRFKAPVGALTDDMRQAIGARKQAFIDHLSASKDQTRIPADPENRYEPFPLTDLQVAYIVGRRSNYELGGVGCHSYIELELPRLDHARLEAAWHKLIRRHDMLRAVISTDGQQRVLKNVTLPPVAIKDLAGQSRENFDLAVKRSRDEMAFRCYDSECWPLYELRLTQHNDKAILHHSTDLLIADFASIQILLAELGDLYDHPNKDYPPLAVTFRDILQAKLHRNANKSGDEQARYQKHKDYWINRITTIPGAPELPITATLPSAPPTTPGDPTFQRLSLSLDTSQWDHFCQQATEHKITPSSVVLNAFAEVLRRWSRNADFCINLTLLNRLSDHPDIPRVVGDFIAVNVLEVNDDRGERFIDRAQALQQQLWQDMAHSDFTGIEVLREMTRQQQGNVLIPVVFTSTIGVTGNTLPENAFMHHAKLNYGITQTPQVWLDCQATERNGELHIDWDIRLGVFMPQVIEQAFASFRTLLENLSSQPEYWQQTDVVTLPAQTLAQRDSLNNEKNTPLPQGYLHQAFCQQVLSAPTQTALLCGNQSWSYRELARWALAIANKLHAVGCQPGEPVALFLDKSPLQIAAVMGVLLAKGSYVPIDITQPAQRCRSILEDSGAKWVICSTEQHQHPWPQGVEALAMDPELTDSTTLPDTQQVNTAMHAMIIEGMEADTTNQLAYILYTSGTTGKPKGVMLSHQGVANTIAGFNDQFAFSAEDRTLALVNYSFDLSVLDIFCTFTAGATLVLPDSQWRTDPGSWATAIEQHNVTVWNSVPAHMQMLMAWHENHTECDLSSLRIAFISGDWIPVTLPSVIHQHLPELSLNSLGGPTEISVTCIYNPIKEVPPYATNIPYGTPLRNHKLYIQNSRFEDCPDWTPGEMLVGGPGVALGFANDPARTAQRFITHPRTGERLYRTGDICRYRPDGVIEILGREDNQVKIRGHRIELGEVEAALNELPYIKQAVALTRTNPVELVTALVLADNSASADCTVTQAGSDNELTHIIQSDLQQVLPGYMIPSTCKVMEVIPLTANNKVDRKTLKKMFASQIIDNTAFEPPKDNWIEQKLAEIWCELTDIERLSRNDDFFMIGGSSLSAVSLLNRLTEERFAVNIDLIFNNPMFKDMVEALQKGEDEEERFRQAIDIDALFKQVTRHCDHATPYLPQHTESAPAKVFMTGATGYLGIYILKSVLEQTNDTLYCLIRCRDEENGYFRLQQLADEKGLSLQLDRTRIKIIPGDLTADQFGIAPKRYQWLTQNIDKVLHIAALISLIAPLSSLYPINVKGSANVIELASTHKIKPIHYMSTIGVHYRLPYHKDEPPVPEDTNSFEPWHKPELTYEHTKYMAEQLFYMARQRQIPVNIFRSGAITWDNTQVAPFINDDAFVKFFRTCLSINAYPDSQILISTTPVNVVARYIAQLSKPEITSEGKNYHVVSRYSHTGDQIYQWLNSLGSQFEKLGFKQWNQKLADSFGRGFINRYFKHGMDQGGHHQYRIDNLEAALAAIGEVPFEVTPDYFTPIVDHFSKAIRQAAKQSTVTTKTEV